MSSSEHPKSAPVTFLVFDAYAGGGVARATTNLANRLVATRQVRIISLYRRRRRARYRLDPAIDVTVLRDVRRTTGRTRTLLDQLPSRLRPAPSARNMSLLTDLLLRRAIRRVRTGVIISTRPSLHLALATFARRGVTTVGWDHLNFTARSSKLGQARVLRAAVPRLDGYVVLTHADAADYRRDMPGIRTTIEVIRNSVSWPIAPCPPGLDEKVVVSAGRLAARKGLGRLVRAFGLIAAAAPDWQLHIYGRGERREQLVDLIHRLGLEPQVLVKGYTRDLPATMRNASVYAMASRQEGFPLVLIEAMSVGLPLIAFDCPRGPAEIIRHRQNGLLIDNGQVHSFADGLLELMTDVELRRRMGRQALRDAESYTLDRVAADWERLFVTLGADGC